MTERNVFVGSIEFFTIGEDFSLYIRRLNHLLSLNKIYDNTSKISFLVSLGGPDLFKVLSSLIAPKLETDPTINYDELVKSLTKHFAPKKNVIAECFKFFKRMQKHDESLQEYIIELKQMAQYCEFKTFTDRALLIQFVCGIKCTKTQNHILNDDKIATFDKATEVAMSLEITNNDVNMLRNIGDDNNINAVASQRQNMWGRREQRGVGGNQELSTSKFNRDRNQRQTQPHSYQQNTPQRDLICFSCGAYGHIKRNCRNKKRQSRKINMIERNEEDNDDEYSDNNSFYCGYINNCKILDNNSHKLTLRVNKQPIIFEVDTGACETIIDTDNFEKYFKNCKISKDNRKMKLISGDCLETYGKITVSIDVENKRYNLELTILETQYKFTPLLGRNWLDVMFPSWRKFFVFNVSELSCNRVNNSSVIDIRNRYKDIFKKPSNSDVIKGFKAEIALKEDAYPIFCKASVVPYGLRSKVEEEIKRLCTEGVLVPVTRSRWASTLVVVNKPNGTIRLCVNCKRTINKFVVSEHIPIPRIDDIFANMAGWKVFCKIDLMGAYLQVEVSERSRELLTINTHIGLFQYTRLIFGLKTAPQIFNGIMCEILRDLDKVHIYFDDILVGGANIEECERNLRNVFDRLKEFNVRVNEEKCIFFTEELGYLGFNINSEGVTPSKESIQAVLNAPEPKNKTELSSYLGMLNFYHKHIPNLSGELTCLYNLIRKNENWEWKQEHKEVFEKSKKLLVDINTLVHYDPRKPIVIACDASPYGVGAVMSHIIEGEERPVMFVSSTLSAAEKNYSQLHREALAIIFAVNKFHKYIYGIRFTIQTDHQPLRAIFGDKKDIPAVAANRLQRWAIILSMYDYSICYRKCSEMKHADGLSRLPINKPTEIEEICINSISSDRLPLNLDDLRREMGNDVLKRVYEHVITGVWPQYIDESLRPFYNKRYALGTEDGCVYYAERLVIPRRMISNILELLHEGHVGIVRMKGIARTYVWWPGIDKNIEDFVNSCGPCQSVQNSPKLILTTWKPTTYPFERIHVDFCKIENITILVLVDSFTKWIDCVIMRKTDAKTVCDELRKIFVIFGLPTSIVSDNGPPFSSEYFIGFCRMNGMEVLKSPAYHPQSNGSAERAVQTVKQCLRKFMIDRKMKDLNWDMKLNNFLMQYRSTPSTVTKMTPSELLFTYKPRTLLDVLVCRKKEGNREGDSIVGRCQNISLNRLPGHRTFIEKEEVLYRNVFSNYIRWIPGRIVKKISSIRYLVQVNGSLKHAHVNQLRKANIRQVQYGPITYCRELRKRLRSNEETNIVTRSKARKMREDEGIIIKDE